MFLSIGSVDCASSLFGEADSGAFAVGAQPGAAWRLGAGEGLAENPGSQCAIGIAG